MRRRRAQKRIIEADPKHNSVLVSRLVNQIMLDGKKTTAQTIVYKALDELVKKSKDFKLDEAKQDETETETFSFSDSSAKEVKLLDKAFQKIRPVTEVKSRQLGGATYQVPIPVDAARSNALAIRWLIEAARSRGEHDMWRKLASELFDALHDKGGAVKKRENTHRMAEANRAYAFINKRKKRPAQPAAQGEQFSAAKPAEATAAKTEIVKPAGDKPAETAQED